MKNIRDLKVGDRIFIKYEINNEIFLLTEIITDIKIGEDGWKGSKRWCANIMTDHTQSPANLDTIKKHLHWPIIVFPLNIKSEQVRSNFQMCNNFYGEIITS